MHKLIFANKPDMSLALLIKLIFRLYINFGQKQSMERRYCRKIIWFVGYTLLIYCCYITSGIYHEKILKYKYRNILDQSQQLFQAPIMFTLFPPLAATLIGFVIICFQKEENQSKLSIPFQKSLICSLIITLNMWTYNKAIVFSSFSAAVMVKSCSLLSVILVGVFCSRVKDESLKLGFNKVWVGIIASIGIVLFNYFKITDNSTDQPLSMIGIMFLLISLLGDGILPDLQAEIKSKFKPSSFDMYYHINRSTLIIGVAYTIVTFQFLYIFEFITTHEQILADIVVYSFLNAIGQLVIYQMIKLFKQHIPSFVIATRKCFTVIVNIIYFGHSVNYMQVFGILFVFLAVMIEVYQNHKQRLQKQTHSIPVAQIECDKEELLTNQRLSLDKAQFSGIVTQQD